MTRALLDRYILFTTSFWRFARWYYAVKPMEIFARFGEYMWAFAEICSFTFLLKTLLSPWKGITDAYPRYGFNIGLIAQALVLNVTSRVMGMIIRIVALIFGVIVELVILVVSFIYLMIWMLYPAIFVTGIVYLVRSFFFV